MKMLLAMTLMFATVLAANAQTGKEKSEFEIAVQKAMTELRRVPSDLTVLDESNKKLAKSNQAQLDTTKMLDKLQRKIQYEDAPALDKKIDELNAKIQRTRASGCPEERTEVSVEMANRCNALNAETNRERATLAAAQDNLASQVQMINQTRQTVYTTTLENAAQQKKNDAVFNDLQAKKLALYSLVITRSMSIVRSKAVASKACATLPLEKAHCCLSVVNDGKDPAQCDLELLFKLFEAAGAFSTTEVKPFTADANQATRLPTVVVAKWSGNWGKQEKALVHDALLGVKDEGLRNWISANVQFTRSKLDGVSPLSATGTVLRFKDDFFTKTTTAKQEDLIAFEAGKAFWASMKDKPVGEGKTLERWFGGYSGGHISAIGNMHKAKHRNNDFFTHDRIDAASSFAHIFRAYALQLDKPKEQKAQKEWDGVIREFRTRIVPLLRDK